MAESALKPFGVDVIGTGKHGSRYAAHLYHDLPGFHLQAISRRAEEGRRQADKWECRHYTDWQHLVADDAVDCVVAAVPLP